MWRQSTRLWRVSQIFYVNVNSDPEGTSWLSLSTETGLHSAYCAADREDLTDTVLRCVVDAPVVVQRQVPWFRRYRIPWSFCSCSLVNRWPISLLCWFAVAVHRQGLFCLMGEFRCILRHFSRSVRMDVSAHFSALHDEEFFVVEGSGWRGRRELAPRCSATPIRCMRAVMWINTSLLHLVRTTTTTQPGTCAWLSLGSEPATCPRTPPASRRFAPASTSETGRKSSAGTSFPWDPDNRNYPNYKHEPPPHMHSQQLEHK